MGCVKRNEPLWGTSLTLGTDSRAQSQEKRAGGGAATLGLDFLRLETMGTPGPWQKAVLTEPSHSIWFPSRRPGRPTSPRAHTPSVAPRAPTTEANGSSALLLKTGNAESAQGIPRAALALQDLVSSCRSRLNPEVEHGGRDCRGLRPADHLPTESNMMRFCWRALWLCVRASSSRVRSRWKVRSPDREGRLVAAAHLPSWIPIGPVPPGGAGRACQQQEESGPRRRGSESRSSADSISNPAAAASSSRLHWLLPGRSCARAAARPAMPRPAVLMVPLALDTQGQRSVRCASGSLRGRRSPS